MDIKQLRYFVQIVDSGSFSRAAKELFVTQPTLSKSVQNLERTLGVELLHISGKRIQVTEYGQHLYEMARGVLEQHENIFQTIHNLTNLQKGMVRLGIPPIIGTCVFPKLIAGFIQTYPGIELVLDQHGANHVQRMVEQGELDVAFTILPVISEALDVIPLVQDKNVVIFSENHDLASRAIISYEELSTEKFVLFNEEYMLYVNIIAGCREAGFEPRVVVKASQWDFLVQLVKLDMGISILPRPILDMYTTEGIRYVELDHASGVWDVAMVSSKTRYTSLAVQTFLSYIHQHAESSY